MYVYLSTYIIVKQKSGKPTHTTNQLCSTKKNAYIHNENNLFVFWINNLLIFCFNSIFIYVYESVIPPTYMTVSVYICTHESFHNTIVSKLRMCILPANRLSILFLLVCFCLDFLHKILAFVFSFLLLFSFKIYPRKFAFLLCI